MREDRTRRRRLYVRARFIEAFADVPLPSEESYTEEELAEPGFVELRPLTPVERVRGQRYHRILSKRMFRALKGRRWNVLTWSDLHDFSHAGLSLSAMHY